MYVRTKSGYIAKLIDIDYEAEYYEFDEGIVWVFEYLKDIFDFDDEDLKQITKASHNIIDLIEVGDYVNGVLINYINNKGVFHDAYDCEDVVSFTNEEDIKSIVTKEQFESMEYKVEDK